MSQFSISLNVIRFLCFSAIHNSYHVYANSLIFREMRKKGTITLAQCGAHGPDTNFTIAKWGHRHSEKNFARIDIYNPEALKRIIADHLG